MTATMPDLAPGAPSRVLTIDATILTEDAPKDGTIVFTLEGDLRVPASGKIIAASRQTVRLVDGQGQIRVPTIGAAVADDAGDSWYILVKKSWLTQPYAIRVPSGTSPIALGSIAPAQIVPAAVNWALSSASVTMKTLPPGSTNTAAVDLRGGTLELQLGVAQGPQGLPGPGAVAADDAVSTYVQTPSKTSIALDKVYRRGYSPREFGVVGDGVADDTAALRAMRDAIPAGARIDCPPGDRYRLTGALTLTKPVTIVGGTWLPVAGGTTIIVSSNDVTLESMSFPGPGTLENVDAHRFITTTGTKEAPINNLTVRDCTFYGTQHSFMWLDWIMHSRIVGCQMDRFLYAGLMLLSPRDVLVQGNTVENGHIIAPVVNCYGLCATDTTNIPGDEAQDVTFLGNTIDGIPWNGIDTHGGTGIKVIGNTIMRCRTGIAMTIGNSARVIAPTRVAVVGNVVEAGGLAAAEIWRGILLDGWPDYRADGAIQGNTVRGYPERRSISLLNVDRTRTRCSGNTSPEQPWTDLTLGSGWSSGHADMPPQYKVEDDRVHVRGIAAMGAGAGDLIGRITADATNRSGWSVSPTGPFAVIGSMLSTIGLPVMVRAVAAGAETEIRYYVPNAAWTNSSPRNIVLNGSYPIN